MVFGLPGLGREMVQAVVKQDLAVIVDVTIVASALAPEQLLGKGASVRSDLYSLGLVLYEICTGRRAFAAAARRLGRPDL